MYILKQKFDLIYTNLYNLHLFINTFIRCLVLHIDPPCGNLPYRKTVLFLLLNVRDSLRQLHVVNSSSNCFSGCCILTEQLGMFCSDYPDGVLQVCSLCVVTQTSVHSNK